METDEPKAEGIENGDDHHIDGHAAENETELKVQIIEKVQGDLKIPVRDKTDHLFRDALLIEKEKKGGERYDHAVHPECGEE
jgi:hypothetical protein